MTVLSVIQNAAVLCNMPRPDSALSSTEAFEQEMSVLLARAGQEIIRRHDWGRLIKTQDYSTNGTSTVFTVPSDFQRLVTNSAVSYGAVNYIRGGLSDAEWRLQARQAGASHRYRLLGNSLHVLPAVSLANSPITVQYISRNWLLNNGGTPIDVATADNDVPVLPERLLVSCLVWMWKRLKKQSYQSELAEYEDDLAQEIASDRNFRIPTSGAREAAAKMEAQA